MRFAIFFFCVCVSEDTVEGFKELEIEEVKKLGGGDSYLKWKKRCPGFSSQLYQLSSHCITNALNLSS